MRILREESITLVIDMQERLFPHIDQHDSLLKNTRMLLQGMDVLELPVIHTEQYRKGLGPTLKEIESLLPDKEPIEKMTFSCCDDDAFLKELEKSNAKNVIICGIETHVCVLQTVIDLLEKGLRPVIVEDCVSSREAKDKEIAILRMRQEGAIITSYESVLFELARVSGTDQFKAISKLVK